MHVDSRVRCDTSRINEKILGRRAGRPSPAEFRAPRRSNRAPDLYGVMIMWYRYNIIIILYYYDIIML